MGLHVTILRGINVPQYRFAIQLTVKYSANLSTSISQEWVPVLEKINMEGADK
jgi:hypothetical protein